MSTKINILTLSSLDKRTHRFDGRIYLLDTYNDNWYRNDEHNPAGT